MAMLLLVSATYAATPEESLREALRLEKTGAFRKALKIYGGFLTEHPEHVRTTDVRYRITKSAQASLCAFRN